MKNKTTNILFPLSRSFLRLFNKKYIIKKQSTIAKPAVYIVHHQNLRGPFTTMLWYDEKIHPWVLSVFCSQGDCYRQYYDYTFTQRFKIPKPLAAILAFPISFYVSGLAKSMESIPVYRNSMSIIKTFKSSINVLSLGESILVCPDIDYSNSSNEIGEMYSGFLDLEKFYFKETGEHLPFIPVYINTKIHQIEMDKEITFRDNSNFQEEKKLVYEKLRTKLMELNQGNSDV